MNTSIRFTQATCSSGWGLDRLIRSLLALVVLALLAPQYLHAQNAWQYADSHPANLPLPWAGGGPAPAVQMIKHEHGNWHFTFPSANNASWGARFVAFHRQFILDYDLWRNTNGRDRVEPWDYAPGATIPGYDETYGTGFPDGQTNCELDPGEERPAAATCTGCGSLPADLTVPSISSFSSLGAIGARLEFSGYHGSFHVGVRNQGCPDIGGSFVTAPRDPVFWMGHKKVDEVARDWQRLKAADVVVVLDRSGSMLGQRLQDAKTAALLFADLVKDSPTDGSDNRAGLVTFSSTATALLGGGVLAASTLVTDNGVVDTPFETAVDGITASGATSIGAGLQQAVTVLNNVPSPNDHRAILLLSDGLENTAPFISDVAGAVGLTQVVAIGIGEGAREDNLRALAEQTGGLFIADQNLADDGITMRKFFVDGFGQIFDETISEDPILVFPAGEVSSAPVTTELTGSDSRLTVVAGYDEQIKGCPLQLVVETPSGAMVDLSGVETSNGEGWTFARLPLPYQGEQAGTWTAFAIRPQQVFMHSFATDAFRDPEPAVALVRRELHRLGPAGTEQVLYYEDGSVTGFSIYREALERELKAGTIGEVVQADDPEAFNELLLKQPWDVIVFARQRSFQKQDFDDTLSRLLCEGQKALITDFGILENTSLYECLGVSGTTRTVNWEQAIGDGRLLTESIQLANPGYQIFSFGLVGNPQLPVLMQATNERGTGAIAGRGSFCPDQRIFYSTLVRGLGHVRPFHARPRVVVGQPILATFRITESNRPTDGYDKVEGTVTLRRPGKEDDTETYQLFDDGSNGDKLPDNYVLSRLIPEPTQTDGPHLLHGQFFLTEGGQTIRREVEYTVIVEPRPGACGRLNTIPETGGVPGAALPLQVSFVHNLCASRETFTIRVADRQGWLHTLDDNGSLVPLPGGTSLTTPVIEGGKGLSLHEAMPLFIVIPPNAPPGAVTEVNFALSGANETAGTRVSALDASNIPVLTLQIDEVAVGLDRSFELPILVDRDPAGLGVTSYAFALQFDDDLLAFVGVETAGTLSEDLDVAVMPHGDHHGTVLVEASGRAPLAGSAPLLRLRFRSLHTEGVDRTSFGDMVLATRLNDGNPAVIGLPGAVTIDADVNTITAVLSKPAGWSLASIPVLGSFTLRQIFPHFVSAFTFEPDQGYVGTTAPEPTEGFWLNLSEPDLATFIGLPVDSYERSLPGGWSLIGGLSADPAQVVTDPPLQALFRFDPGEGYLPTTAIPVGEAAWINCPAPCEATVTPDEGHAHPGKQAADVQEALIAATGEAVDGYVSRGRVVLGTGASAQAVPYPPELPAYTVQLRLLAQDDPQQALYSDLRPPGSGLDAWVLELDPNGNTEARRTATLRWDGAALRAIADVPWTLREGTGGTGRIVVADMRQAATLMVSGTEPQYFTISTAGTATGTEAAALPDAFALLENYPNPFNPTTQIRYDVPHAAQVTIRVYNVLGQQVKTLLDGTVDAGRHTVVWDGRDQSGALLPSGVYFSRMETVGFVQTRRMVLLK